MGAVPTSRRTLRVGAYLHCRTLPVTLHPPRCSAGTCVRHEVRWEGTGHALARAETEFPTRTCHQGQAVTDAAPTVPQRLVNFWPCTVLPPSVGRWTEQDHRMTASSNDRARRRAIRSAAAEREVPYSEAARGLDQRTSTRSPLDPQRDTLVKDLGHLYRRVDAFDSTIGRNDVLTFGSMVGRARSALQIALAHIAADLITNDVVEELAIVARGLNAAAQHVGEADRHMLSQMVDMATARHRDAQAIERDRCLLGCGADTTCSGPERVRVRSLATGGPGPSHSDWGCVRHAAGTFADWAMQMTAEVVVIGDDDAAVVATYAAAQRLVNESGQAS